MRAGFKLECFSRHDLRIRGNLTQDGFGRLARRLNQLLRNELLL